jgi:hypothetical protein
MCVSSRPPSCAAVLDHVVPLLKRWGQARRLLITSFWHTVIEHISQQLDIACGILVAHWPFASAVLPFGWWPPTGHAQTVVWSYLVVDAEILAQTARQGIRNLVYGAETERDRVHCATLAVRAHRFFPLDKGRVVSRWGISFTFHLRARCMA